MSPMPAASLIQSTSSINESPVSVEDGDESLQGNNCESATLEGVGCEFDDDASLLRCAGVGPTLVLLPQVRIVLTHPVLEGNVAFCHHNLLPTAQQAFLSISNRVSVFRRLSLAASAGVRLISVFVDRWVDTAITRLTFALAFCRG